LIYNSFVVPVRTPQYDAQGRLSRTWQDFLGGVARKAGRSALWRGVYDDTLQYQVCDLVRREDSLWIALQAQPVQDIGAVEPGTDDTVWELVLKSSAHGIPPGGKKGQVLTKLSDADYDVGWMDVGVSTHAEALTDGAGSFITAAGELIYVTGVPD